jgi:hypothetical protein
MEKKDVAAVASQSTTAEDQKVQASHLVPPGEPQLKLELNQ